MTADIEMLPLPEPDYLMPQGQGWPDIPAWSENTVRQLVAHHAAAKDAEIEALRALMGGVEVQRDANWQAYTAEKARAERLVEALRWYAEQAELCRKLGAAGDSGRRALDADGGKRARAALRDHDQQAAAEANG